MRLSKLKAFTLTEVLVSIAIAAIVSSIFYAIFVMGVNYIHRIMELQTAHLILQEQASSVRELSFTEVQALGGSFVSTNMTSLIDATGAIAKAPYNGNSEIIRITFTLDWKTFYGESAQKSIVTLITDHGINKK